MFKKSLLLWIAVLFGLVAMISAATVSVAPGEGTLKAAIAAANSGDVLRLESGGLYTTLNDRALIVDKALTIKAVDGAEARPVIEMHVIKDSLYNASFFQLQDGSSIKLDNIELNGLLPDTSVFNAANEFIDLPENATITSIEIYNCLLHDALGNVVDGGASGAVVDRVIIENSLVGNCNGGPEFDDSALTGSMTVTNSTFWNLSNRFIRAQPGGGDSEGIIENCTIYNVAGKRIIMAKGNNKKWLIKNSIFSTFTGSNADDCIRPGNNEADTLAFTILHNNVGLHKDWDVVADTSSADPLFNDPDNGDFTLGEGSQALTMGSDGGAIGDPRWAGGSSAVEKQASKPETFVLNQNYPNPFNPSTTISFSLKNRSMVTLSVFNTKGQLIETLIDNYVLEGQHNVTWNAGNLTSGVYFYKLRTAEKVAVRKMILMQ